MKADPEQRPLLPSQFQNEQDAKKLANDFLIFCMLFSINHGCVICCVAYASSEFGSTLSGIGNGVFYLGYALVSFFVAKPIVTMLGPKITFIVAATGYCVYVTGFLCALAISDAAWPIFITACCIGGIAGGLLWPSQGRYFARNAKLYSEKSGIPIDQANSTFAGVFAANYLGFEMVTKVLATIIFVTTPNPATYVVFGVYTTLAILSAFLLLFINDLGDIGTGEFRIEEATDQVLSSGRLVMEDFRLGLLLPYQISYGFASSFIIYYILGSVFSDSSSLGSSYVGLLSAVSGAA
jgi:hypothetical protein